MRQIHVICKEGKDGKKQYLKLKKYNGIHYTFSSYIIHSRQFDNSQQAEDFLLNTNDLSGQLEIKALWVKDIKETKDQMDRMRDKARERFELEEVGQIA